MWKLSTDVRNKGYELWSFWVGEELRGHVGHRLDSFTTAYAMDNGKVTLKERFEATETGLQEAKKWIEDKAKAYEPDNGSH